MGSQGSIWLLFDPQATEPVSQTASISVDLLSLPLRISHKQPAGSTDGSVCMCGRLSLRHSERVDVDLSIHRKTELDRNQNVKKCRV